MLRLYLAKIPPQPHLWTFWLRDEKHCKVESEIWWASNHRKLYKKKKNPVLLWLSVFISLHPPFHQNMQAHEKGTWCCGLRSSFGVIVLMYSWSPLFQPSPASLCKQRSQFRGNEGIYLHRVFCSFRSSKDLRTLFVLKQVTGLLHLHIPNFPGAACRVSDLKNSGRLGWPSAIIPSHPCLAFCVLVWFCF